LYEKNNIVVIDDFAHHPTAVRETLEGLKKKFSDHKLFAIFEPRSATSVRNIFEKEYTHAFNSADLVILKSPFDKGQKNKLDVEKISQQITKKYKIPAFSAESTNEIIQIILENIKNQKSKNSNTKTVIVFMSNGEFGGVQEKIIKKVKKLK
jgi:UDP-N-acetylmuramate: L-alanyl-gamma-D-glutamyl-meso-diaminopimelate ligase